MPRVSVIIPVHNRADLIGATLQSVLAQTRLPEEVFVIDDGSTDATAEVVAKFTQKSGGGGISGGIRLVRQENAGPSAARNHGLSLARGEYIAFLDADDLWLPRKLERQIAVLEAQPEVAGVYCRMFKFCATLDDLGRPEPQNMIAPPAGVAGVEHILRTMCIQSSTAVVRSSVIRGAHTGEFRGGLSFDEKLRAAEDAIFFAEIALRGPWRMVDEALVAYRVHDVQLTKEAWHGVKTTEARAAWCRANVSRLGAANASAWEAHLWGKLIEGVEKMYWRRDLKDLPALCAYLHDACPQQFAASFLATRRLWPRWVYRLHDLLRR